MKMGVIMKQTLNERIVSRTEGTVKYRHLITGAVAIEVGYEDGKLVLTVVGGPRKYHGQTWHVTPEHLDVAWFEMGEQ